MSNWTAGENLSPERMQRLSADIPTTYTIFKQGTTYYAETNDPSGTYYNGTNAKTLIQQAIDACGSSGGRIHFQRGTFTLDAAPTISNPLVVTGEGKETIFKIDDNALCSAFRIEGTSGVALRDFYVDGNKANNTYVSGTHYTIEFDDDGVAGCTDCLVDGVWVENGSDGIMIHSALSGSPTKRMIVNNCQLNSNDFVGVVACGYGNETTISNCVCYNNSWWGIELCGTAHQGVLIQGCQIVDNVRRGIVVGHGNSFSIMNNYVRGSNAADYYCVDVTCADSGGVGGDDSVITGNIIEDGKYGILATKDQEQPYRLVISNNAIYDFYYNGIYLNYVNDAVVSNNVIKGTSGTTYNGIHAKQVYDSSIMGNVIQHGQSTGILLDDASRNVVVGNNIRNYNRGIKQDTSTYNHIVGNYLYNNDKGITEIDSSDYSSYSGNMPYNSTTAAYDLIGTHNIYDGKERTATSVDLSGGADILVVFQSEEPRFIPRATVVYTEASSGDAGITIEIGKANGTTDRDYYYTGTTAVSQAQWTNTQLTLLKNDVAAGDTVTFYSAGGKTGTGEIMLVLDWLMSR